MALAAKPTIPTIRELSLAFLSLQCYFIPMDTSDTTTTISNQINGDKSDKPALRWTPRQQAIDALTQAGLGTGAIAKTLNVSRQCVQQTHQKLGRSDLKNPAFVRLAAKSVKSVLQGLSDTYEEQVVTRQGDIVTLTKSIPVRPGDKLQAAAMALH